MNIVFLTGYSGAGKSTLADYLCQNYDFATLSFRNVTKSVADAHGISHVDYIEKTDNDTVFNEVTSAMIQQIKDAKAENMLVDGLYDIKGAKVIQQAFAESKSQILAVESDYSLRKNRLNLRQNGKESTLDDLEYLDQYKRNLGIEGVLANADLTIRNDDDISSFQQKIDLFATCLRPTGLMQLTN